MNQSAAKKVAFMGLLFALSIAFSYLENLIPAIAGMPPGIKLGLSNIVTMFCLFFMGAPWAFAIAVSKSLFSLLLRGFTAALLSLSGGVLSVTLMSILLLPKREKSSVGFVSIAGAVAHNVGQLVVARFLLGTDVLFYYLPVLIISGVVMGSVTGIVFTATKPYLEKLGGFLPVAKKKRASKDND